MTVVVSQQAPLDERSEGGIQVTDQERGFDVAATNGRL